MGLIDYGRETADADYVSKIQTFNRFMLEQFISEGNSFPHNPRIVSPASQTNPSGDFIAPAPAPITQLFGIDAKSNIICDSCGARRDKEGLAHVVEMLYPKKVNKNLSARSNCTDCLSRHSRTRRLCQVTLPPSSETPWCATCPTAPPAKLANSSPLNALGASSPAETSPRFLPSTRVYIVRTICNIG